MSEGMRTEMPDACSVCSPDEFPPHAGVAVGQPAKLEGTGEDPIRFSREPGALFPQLQVLQQFKGNDEGLGRALRLKLRHFLLDNATPDAKA
jgi:hypothetical protein